MRRFLIKCAAGLLVALAIGIATPSVASAELVALTCPGTLAVAYTPGLTTAAQPTTFVGTATGGPCLGVPLGIVSGTLIALGTGTLSCLGGTATVGLAINWSDGTSSVATGSFLVSVRTPVLVETVVNATVVSGRFFGATLAITNTVVPDLLACLTPTGITNSAGPATLTVLGF